jgi:HK97 family phage prohead protease
MTVAMERAAEERKAAAEARTAGAAQQNYYRSAPGPGVTVTAPLGAARSLAFPAEMRAKKEERNGQLMYHLTGIASVTNTPYEMYDMFGPYEEVMDHHAFDETLANEPDVAFLVNHRGLSMARTTNGTLELSMVKEGLNSEAWLNAKRSDISDLVIAVDDRTVDQMSFAFMLEEGWWSEDFSTFKITKVNLDRGDVSAVNYGANPYTSIAARSREILDDLDQLPEGAKRAAIARLSAPQDSTPIASDAEPPTPEMRGDLTGRSILALSAWIAAAEDHR